MKKTILIYFVICIFFSGCALEVANVIGPAGGYVFIDKGNYNDGYRYVECSPEDLIDTGIKWTNKIDVLFEARESVNKYTFGGFNDWDLPTDVELVKMLQSFRWDLSRFWFRDEWQYLDKDGNVHRNTFKDNILFGEQIEISDSDVTGRVLVRAVRRF